MRPAEILISTGRVATVTTGLRGTRHQQDGRNSNGEEQNCRTCNCCNCLHLLTSFHGSLLIGHKEELSQLDIDITFVPELNAVHKAAAVDADDGRPEAHKVGF